LLGSPSVAGPLTLLEHSLASNAFFIGAAAHDADDHIIYDSVTGSLIYDSNGSLAGGATVFATLTPALLLTNAEVAPTRKSGRAPRIPAARARP
jgi:hypothetical protein